jgi:hypothetical protein
VIEEQLMLDINVCNSTVGNDVEILRTQGYTYKEISQELGISIKAIKNVLHEGRNGSNGQ